MELDLRKGVPDSDRKQPVYVRSYVRIYRIWGVVRQVGLIPDLVRMFVSSRRFTDGEEKIRFSCLWSYRWFLGLLPRLRRSFGPLP